MNQYSVLSPYAHHSDPFSSSQMCNITYKLNSNDFATKFVPTQASHLMAHNMLEWITSIPFGENISNSTDQSRDQQRFSGLGVSSIKKAQGSAMPDTWKNTKEVISFKPHANEALTHTEDQSPLKDNTQMLHACGNSNADKLQTKLSSSHVFPSSQNLKK